MLPLSALNRENQPPLCGSAELLNKLSTITENVKLLLQKIFLKILKLLFASLVYIPERCSIKYNETEILISHTPKD